METAHRKNLAAQWSNEYSLQSLLNTAHFRAGINTRVFMHFVTVCRKCLKKTGTVVSYLMKCRSEKMSGLIRNLTALRDSRILEVNMICNVANHALLFMVRGLHRKWKQSVAYYLSRGSTKVEMLVQFLKDVLGACQNVGLHVVATVCDMGTNSVRPRNCWLQQGDSHSSSLKIKQLQQYMTLHNS